MMEDEEAEAWAECLAELIQAEEHKLSTMRTSDLLARNDRIFNG